nr:hypothetical protein [Yoonia sp.]
MRLFAGMEVFVFRVIFLTFMAQMANADAYSSAQRALENLKKNCYPDINAVNGKAKVVQRAAQNVTTLGLG